MCRNHIVVPLRSLLLVTVWTCQPPTANLDERHSSSAREIGYMTEQRYTMDTMSHVWQPGSDALDGAFARPSNGPWLADLPALVQAKGTDDSSNQRPALSSAHNEDFRGPALEPLSPGPLARRLAVLRKLFHELGQGLRDAALAGGGDWARTDPLLQADPTHRRLACKRGTDGGHGAALKSLLWRPEVRRNAGALPDHRQCKRGALGRR